MTMPAYEYKNRVSLWWCGGGFHGKGDWNGQQFAAWLAYNENPPTMNRPRACLSLIDRNGVGTPFQLWPPLRPPKDKKQRPAWLCGNVVGWYAYLYLNTEENKRNPRYPHVSLYLHEMNAQQIANTAAREASRRVGRPTFHSRPPPQPFTDADLPAPEPPPAPCSISSA